MRLSLLLVAALALAACNADAPEASGAPDAAATPEAPQTAEATSTVTVDYRGTLPDGSVFDEGERVTFSLLQVVPGFQSNIAGMTEGETKTFVVPPEEGYGGAPPPGIPPGTDLTFEVTLHEVR